MNITLISDWIFYFVINVIIPIWDSLNEIFQFFFLFFIHCVLISFFNSLYLFVDYLIIAFISILFITLTLFFLPLFFINYILGFSPHICIYIYTHLLTFKILVLLPLYILSFYHFIRFVFKTLAL